MSDIQIARHPTDTGTYRLTTEVWLPRSRDEVLAYFADAGNLQAITPPWLHFSILTPRPFEMRQGALIDYRLRLRGILIGWRTEITAWEPPARFVDEQLRGPYRLWRHEHTFEESQGGTLMRDAVDYRVPGGALVHTLLVRRDLQKIFEYRRDVLLKKLG
jgi:ligand-binding SRPBCC domain-containing protein